MKRMGLFDSIIMIITIVIMILIIIVINKVEMFEKSQAKAEFFASIMGRGIMMVALSLIKYRCNMIIMIIDHDSFLITDHIQA